MPTTKVVNADFAEWTSGFSLLRPLRSKVKNIVFKKIQSGEKATSDIEF